MKFKCAKMPSVISILIWKLNGNFGARINWLLFSCLIDSFFEFLILHSFFIFIKKWKTKYSSFFILMKKLKNELLKQIKINFTIIITSIAYTLFKSQFVSSPPKVFLCAMVTRRPRIPFLKNSWFILMFTLLAVTFIFGSFS